MGQLLKFMFLGFLGLVALAMISTEISKAMMSPAEKAAAAAERAAKVAEDAKPSPPEDLARVACKKFIALQLNDPDAAEFGDIYKWSSIALKDGKYRVRAVLRGKNAFGALMLAEFRCDVQLDDRGWTLANLEQLSP